MNMKRVGICFGYAVMFLFKMGYLTFAIILS